MKMLKTLALAAFTAFAAMPAVAATEPVFDVPFATAEYFSDGAVGEFLLFDAAATGENFAFAGDLFATLLLTFDLGDLTASFGDLTLASDDGDILNGALKSVAESTDLVTLIFGDLTGPLATVFGNQVTVEVFFFDALGDNPISAMSAGNTYDVALTGAGQPAPVPLPAGFLLIATGGAALGALRLRKSRG